MMRMLPVGKLPFELLGSLLASAQICPTIPSSSDLDSAATPRSSTSTARLLVIKNDPITFVSQEAGVYLVNVNANDLSCLGAVPRWMLVTALLARDRLDDANCVVDALRAAPGSLRASSVSRSSAVTPKSPPAYLDRS